MITLRNAYEMTDIGGISLTGAESNASMFPSAERCAWVNEVVRTAELRGSFVPQKYGCRYASLSAKDVIGGMIPQPLTSLYSRLNNAVSEPYCEILTGAGIPRGLWSEFNYSAEIQYGGVKYANLYLLSLGDITNKIAEAMTSPSPGQYNQSMWPSVADNDTFRDVAYVGTRSAIHGRMISRSTIVATFPPPETHFYNNYPKGAGIQNVVSSSGGRFVRDDGTEFADPSNDGGDLDWLGCEPFLGLKSVHSYYTAKLRGRTRSYYYEADDWNYYVDVAPWSYSGDARDRSKQATVIIVPIYGVFSHALWGTSADPTDLMQDKIVNTRIFVPNDNIIARRTSETSYLTDLSSLYSTQPIKNIAESILSAVRPDQLPSSGPWTAPSHYTERVGYLAYVEPIWAVMQALPAVRNLGD